MAETIAQMFGPMPYEIDAARRQQDEAYATKMAGMNNIQQAKLGIGQGAAGIARSVGGMFGMVDPAIEQANERNQVMSGVSPTDWRSLAEAAIRTQDPRLKMQLGMLAQQRRKEEVANELSQAKTLAELHKARTEASPLAKLSPKDYTPESWGEYIKTGDTSKLRAVEKTPFESMSNEEKLVRATLLAKGLKEGTPEWNAAAAPLFQKLMDKRTHFNINTGVAGGEAATKEEVDFYAEMAMSGDQSWRVGLGRSKDGVALIRAVDKRMPEMAAEVGMKPGDVVANKQEVATRLKAMRDFSTGTQGQLVTSFNTAIDHLDTLKDLGVALNNGNLQLANKIKNTAAAWTGDADITNLDTAKQIVGAEVIKSIVARGGGQAEREEAANQISRISSPAQLSGYIETTQKLMAGQLKSLEQQYSSNTKRTDFRDKLLPRAKNVLSSLGRAEKSEGSVSQVPANTSAQKRFRFDAQGNMVQ